MQVLATRPQMLLLSCKPAAKKYCIQGSTAGRRVQPSSKRLRGACRLSRTRQSGNALPQRGTTPTKMTQIGEVHALAET
jgi:hypothetical protein